MVVAAVDDVIMVPLSFWFVKWLDGWVDVRVGETDHNDEPTDDRMGGVDEDCIFCSAKRRRNSAAVAMFDWLLGTSFTTEEWWLANAGDDDDDDDDVLERIGIPDGGDEGDDDEVVVVVVDVRNLLL